MATRTRTRNTGIDDNTKELIKYGAVLAIGYFGIVRPLTNMLHLTKSAATKQEEAKIEANSKASGWNPNYWRSVKVPNVLHTSNSSALATKLYWRLFPNAIFLNDDEETVYGVLRQMQSQADLSYLCYTFFNLYKADLYNYIKSCFNTSEMVIVANITSALPPYIIVKK